MLTITKSLKIVEPTYIKCLTLIEERDRQKKAPTFLSQKTLIHFTKLITFNVIMWLTAIVLDEELEMNYSVGSFYGTIKVAFNRSYAY